VGFSKGVMEAGRPFCTDGAATQLVISHPVIDFSQGDPKYYASPENWRIVTFRYGDFLAFEAGRAKLSR
jgi:hypothetical protein